MDLRQNLDEVEEQIQAACARAGRKREEVTLVAVSKTKPVSMLKEIYDCGIRDFGENKVQELCGKIPALPGDIRWHMIGHLQTNKVRAIVGQTVLIHSVDSLRLAEEIEKRSAAVSCVSDILIEVNASGEESKFGVTPEDIPPLLERISAMPHIRVCGLMTVAPRVDVPDHNRPVFRKIRQLSVDINRQNIDNVRMDVLSMGMTGDYTVAVEEGATIVRVGTGIFGARDVAQQ